MPILSPAHCPLCPFQSAFWQPALQYVATVHTEHFFSGTPAAPHDQHSFFGLPMPAECRVPLAADGAGDGTQVGLAASAAVAEVEKEGGVEE